MLAGDVDALDQLLSPEAVWVHSSGALDDRGSFLAGFRDGRLECLQLALSEQRVQANSGGGFCAGIVDLDAKVAGERRTSRGRYIAVWLETEHGLKLAHYQSTRLSTS